MAGLHRDFKILRFVFILQLLTISAKHLCAMGISCNDPDVIWCGGDTVGATQIVDRSASGLSATINGGPAWLPRNNSFSAMTKFSTNTYSQAPSSYYYFTRTPGMNYLTANTSLPDFSAAGSQFMIMAQCAYDKGVDAEVVCLSWSTQGASTGWEFRVSNGIWNFALIDIENMTMNIGKAALDTNFHTVGVWKNTGDYRLYFDGVLKSALTSGNNMGTIGGGAPIGFGRATTGTRVDWGGGISNRSQIWRKAVDVNQADSFFKAWHILVNRGASD